MRGIAAAHAIAQRSSVCLARQSTGAIASSRAFAIAAAPLVHSRASINSTAPVLPSLPSLPSLCSRRCFSQTTVRPKKAKKEKNAEASSSKKAQKAESSADGDEDVGSGGTHPAADPEDPFNFDDVESRWQRIESHYQDKFKELRRSISGGASDGGSGGVDVEAIGHTKVSVRAEDLKGDANAAAAAAAASAETPLSQLALIIPRAGGRVVELRMHSPAYRKAIVSAVQKNSAVFHGQQPQPDPDDELVLLVKVGAAAGGAAGAAGVGGAAALAAEHARRIHDLANGWRTQIRKATSRRQKTHQTWKKDRAVRPDDLRRLDRDLLKGQEKRMAKVDSEEKDALRRIEQAGKR